MHIRRNREIMRRLGLGMHDIVTAARQRCGHDADAEDDIQIREEEDEEGDRAPSAARREGPAGEKLEEGIERVLRRSRRLQEKTRGRGRRWPPRGRRGVARRSRRLLRRRRRRARGGG